VIIETPRHSSNKFIYDETLGLFRFKKMLPAGLIFPCDMGFLPHTLGEDGDPLDALVIMEGPTYPGCLIECRLLGVIKVRQKEGRKTFRNDRFIMVPAGLRQYEHIRDIRGLGQNRVTEISFFLESYNRFENKKVEIIGTANTHEALKLIQKQIL
jgi:inorganic pyrophosphatase